MKKAKEIKLVFVTFFIGSVLILSSSAWLPLFTVEKSVIDLIKFKRRYIVIGGYRKL